jgi:rubrerythrin
MALPKIDVPIFELKLPSTGKKIRFRPFTVKEEKLFLMAAEDVDSKSAFNTVIQVLNNCILDEIDVEMLPMFDIELLFLNLRARSIGEVVDISYKCNNNIEEESGESHKCNNVVEMKVNLLEIQPSVDEKHTNKIQLTDKLGIVMKYPNMQFLSNETSGDEFDMIVNLIVDCIEYIYDEESIYYAKDSSREELMEFLDSLQSKELEKVKVFFDTLPKVKKDLEFKCNKCGYNENITLEGIQSFFV